MKSNAHNTENNNPGENEILRFFSPRWFIAIMGTGAVANVLQLLSGKADGALHAGAVWLLLLSVVSFPIASALLLLRLRVDKEMLFKELRHSSLVQFYSAVFIAASVCVTGLVKIPQGLLTPELTLLIAKSYWFTSLAVGVFLVVFTPWRIITLNHGEPRRILGFWFLPPVGIFVLIFAGNFLALKIGDSNWLNCIFTLNSFLLGIALFQTIILFTLFLFRALAYPFPRPDVVPSFTIGLAPIGVSIIALLSYLQVAAKATDAAFLNVAVIAPMIKFGAVLIWGFGLWWLAVALLVIGTAFKNKGVPVTLGYWAFIFPPAAFAIASLVLGQATKLFPIQATGVVLGYLLIVGWITVMLLTLRGILNRSIFALPSSFADLLKEKPVETETLQKASAA